MHVCGFVTCKFMGSVFSYKVSACSSAGAALACTATCHAGETIFVCSLYMCFLCVFICVCVSM